MMMQEINPKHEGIATRLAEALTKSGIESDQPDPPVDHYELAHEAYQICHPDKSKSQFDEWEAALNKPHVPKDYYYRSLGSICKRALRDRGLTKEKRGDLLHAQRQFENRAIDERCNTASDDFDL